MNAVITGATRGIGKAIALALAEEGYNLFLCARTEEEIENFINLLQQKHPKTKFHGFPADCSDLHSLQSFVDFVQEHITTPDVLVNNAGIFIPASIFDEQGDALKLQWELNVQSAYYLSKIFGAEMRSRSGGHIFNICSMASVRPVKEAAAYTVTKFALLGLTKVLQQELKPEGVKVTAVLPGSVFTSSWNDTELKPDKFIQPADVASAILNCLKMSKNANVDELIIDTLRPVN